MIVCGPISVPSPISTSPPMIENAPTPTFAPSAACGWTMAVGWIIRGPRGSGAAQRAHHLRLRRDPLAHARFGRELPDALQVPLDPRRERQLVARPDRALEPG